MKKTIEQVVTETLRNAMNYPPNVAPHVLGTDMSKPIDAVVTALKAAGYEDPVHPSPIPLKITNEVKAFDPNANALVPTYLTVSSNRAGIHDVPSVCLAVYDERDSEVLAYGTNDQDTIIQIIEHMAKMGGLEVSVRKVPVRKRWKPKYQPGDRVRSLAEGEAGLIGTVLSDTESSVGWHVRVLLDGSVMEGLYMYDELEPVTKSS